MAANDRFTTRTTCANTNLLDETDKWTDRGDGFNVKYPSGENSLKELPLVRYIAVSSALIQEHSSPKLGRNVVVKRVDLRGVNEGLKEALKEEAKHLRHLRHYHIVRALGSFSEGPVFGIILEPVASCNLKTYLERPEDDLDAIVQIEERHKMNTSLLPRFMGCLAHALSYIHQEEKVRHCDIKPENILLEGLRPMFADFGLSKAITESRSGSSGPSSKTLMYTSPERAAEVHRNKSDDIFSLACVFAEIYTVSKGRTCKEFLHYREEKDPTGKGYYHRVIGSVIEWLVSLSKGNPERSDVQILRLLTAMFSPQPKARPSADGVWKALTCCTRKGEEKFYCGPCCMPMLNSEISLSEDVSSDLSKAKYASAESFQDASATTKEGFITIERRPAESPFFKTEIQPSQRVGLDWVRNVRHWEQSMVDIVRHDGVTPLLIRKRSISDGDDVQSFLAKNEAMILQQVHHRHMILLFRTYRQGNVLTFLYEPASTYDLRSYLELAEIHPQDAGFLTRSFGCLSIALAKLHKKGFDHGDIRCENITVHVEDERPRILLTMFSLSQKIENDNAWRPHKLMTIIQEYFHGRSEDSRSTKIREIFAKDSTAQYHPPEWEYTGTGQPATDIFALGCVFIEMYTVLSGKKMRDFRKSRKDTRGTAYRYNLGATHAWLDGLEAGREYETKDTFLDIMKCMIDPDPKRRPTAAAVGDTLQTCSDVNRRKRAGDCSVDSSEI